MASKRSIADFDRDITFNQNALSLYYPRSHPGHIHCVYNQAELRWARYRLSQEKEDLDKSIVHSTEAILLPPVSRDGNLLSNVFELFFHLAFALIERSEEFEQSEGIQHSIEYLRYLRRFRLDSTTVTRPVVTTSLIRALNIQVILDSGNGARDIKEMVLLCNEILLSGKSAADDTVAFLYLSKAASEEFNRGLPTEMLDEVIECLRDAVNVCPPGSYKVIYNLAWILGMRFLKTPSNEVYEEANALLERILEPGGCPDSFRVSPSSLSVILAQARSILFAEPEYSEVAHSRLRAERAMFSSPSTDEYERLHLLFAASSVIESGRRFREYGLAESLEEANSYISQIVDLSSSSSWEESAERHSWSEEIRETYTATDIQKIIEHLENLLSISPPGTERHNECLGHLQRWYESKFHHTNDTSDIEASIKYSRLSLD
ncbi:hypothetical protein V8E53_007950 [Lactarius tabidus]